MNSRLDSSITVSDIMRWCRRRSFKIVCKKFQLFSGDNNWQWQQ